VNDLEHTHRQTHTDALQLEISVAIGRIYALSADDAA